MYDISLIALEKAYLLLLVPLASFIVILFLGNLFPKRGAWVGIISIFAIAVQSAILFIGHIIPINDFSYVFSANWFQIGICRVDFGIVIDALSVIMLNVVNIVSLMVHIYSLSYMKGDKRLRHYYAYLSFFTFAMSLLVVSNNFIQTFVGWELIGLASYLLIGFWFQKKEASTASQKAFMFTKFGDIGFFVAILLIFSFFGTFDFIQIQERIQDITPYTSAIIALLLFLAVMGKSAQVPLHVWIPEAMAGPTPSSALIHAATMVAAGVYMMSRAYFIFEHAPMALEIIAWTGAFTSFIAATVALVMTDIKKILAFSTISQLGYMVLALGVGDRTYAMFHLITHAFFKSLLFLGAGSIIHAVHTNDIFKMGGLSKKMIYTFWVFSIAWLAISGVWPFAGFFSKDGILLSALNQSTGLFCLGLFTAFLTAFYMTRLYALVFITDATEMNIKRNLKAHESSFWMLIPMMVLAVLSFFTGFIFEYYTPISQFIPESLLKVVDGSHGGDAEHNNHVYVMIVSSLVAILGIGCAFLMYVKKVRFFQSIPKKFPTITMILKEQYSFNGFYAMLVALVRGIGYVLSAFDQRVFDGIIVDGIAVIQRRISIFLKWVDDVVVDGFVNLQGWIVLLIGVMLRFIHSGRVQCYVIIIFIFLGSFIIFYVPKLMG